MGMIKDFPHGEDMPPLGDKGLMWGGGGTPSRKIPRKGFIELLKPSLTCTGTV